MRSLLGCSRKILCFPQHQKYLLLFPSVCLEESCDSWSVNSSLVTVDGNPENEKMLNDGVVCDDAVGGRQGLLTSKHLSIISSKASVR